MKFKVDFVKLFNGENMWKMISQNPTLGELSYLSNSLGGVGSKMVEEMRFWCIKIG